MTPRRLQFILDVILLIVALCILLFSCQTCRLTAIQDAKSYPQYETRIAVYRVGTDGLIAGLGMWTHHAQAQVKVNGEWKWVSNGLQDEPEYSIDGEIYYWQISIYEAVLEKEGKYN